DEGGAQGLLREALGARDRVAFLDQGVGAQEPGAVVVLLEVEDEPEDFAGELEELARHGALETVDAGDTVAHLDDAPGLLEADLGLVTLQLLLDDLADLFRFDHAYPLTSRSCMRASCPSRLPPRMRL